MQNEALYSRANLILDLFQEVCCIYIYILHLYIML